MIKDLKKRFPDGPSVLRVMTWPLSSLWGLALKECISDRFTARFGIPVHHVEVTGVDAPPGIFQASRDGRPPPCDVLYCNTIPAIHLAQAGLCDALDEAEFPVLKQLNVRAKPIADDLNGWPFVIVYDVRYVMMYREAAFPGGPPKSWKAMLDPTLRGRVSVYPGGKGFFPIAQLAGGGLLRDIPADMAPCWNFLRLLRPQIRVLEFNTRMTEHIRRGEIDLHCTVLTNIMQWKDQGYGVGWHVPNEGSTVGDDALVVPKGLSESTSFWAKQYVAFAVGKDVQRDWTARLGLCPVSTGIERPKRFLGDPAYPDTPDDYSKALYVPNKVLAEFEHGLWRNEFNAILEMNYSAPDGGCR